MMQRYIVFLNDRVVSIDQDINMPLSKIHGQTVYYTDKSALAEAYKRFYVDSDCAFLRIIAAEKFTEACHSFNSFFTRIEAAGGIVRNQKQEYLFIKRLGVWDLPKGKLHKKEAISDAALREVEEETGLTNLSLTKQLPSTFHIYTDRRGREILKETFWFEMMCEEPQNLVPQLEEDITEAKWFAEEMLDIPVKNTYASLRNLLESYLQTRSDLADSAG